MRLGREEAQCRMLILAENTHCSCLVEEHHVPEGRHETAFYCIMLSGNFEISDFILTEEGRLDWEDALGWVCKEYDSFAIFQSLYGLFVIVICNTDIFRLIYLNIRIYPDIPAVFCASSRKYESEFLSLIACQRDFE